jgi:heme-degrading monooxygenase HmoA
MHARVSIIEGSPDGVERACALFREQVLPVDRANGGKAALLLVDRQTGKAIAVTLWDSEEAMQATEDRANELRQQAADEAKATTPPVVERYEVEVIEIA